MSRIAPEGGYDFGNKRQWRRCLYKFIRHAAGSLRHRTRIAMLPSLEGDEIEIAEAYGFKQGNIYAIDDNPAVVATLKRRFPRIRTIGIELARAGERLAGSMLGFANLDLCGNVHGVGPQIKGFARAKAVQAGFVSITVLRGRERNFDEIEGIATESRKMGSIQNSVISKCFKLGLKGGVEESQFSLDMARVQILWGYLCLDDYGKDLALARLCRWGIYRSTAGSQTMLWALFRVCAQPCVCEDCIGFLLLTMPDDVRWKLVGLCDADRTRLAYEEICARHGCSVRQAFDLTAERNKRTWGISIQPGNIPI